MLFTTPKDSEHHPYPHHGFYMAPTPRAAQLISTAAINQDAINDYTTAIELTPDNASYWRRRAHAWNTANPPEAQKSIADATRAIELYPNHHIGYAHRAIAYTLLLINAFEPNSSDGWPAQPSYYSTF